MTRTYFRKRKIKEKLVKLIDNIFTAIGLFILFVLLIVFIPFFIVSQWLSGER